jgi:hypothetical protein
MIEMVLVGLLAGDPYDWQMSCFQTLEAIETVMMDEFFARPENRRARNKLIEKLRRHGPTGCESHKV